MKKLKELVKTDLDIGINGVTSDSRKVKPGFLFVAVNGYNVKHSKFVKAAVANGAVAVITDADIKSKVPVIKVADVNKEMIDICKKFYGISLQDFIFVGITGTDGKTTTATIIYNIIKKKYRCAYIGTNGFQTENRIYPTNNTTPEVEELYYYLSIAKEEKIKYIVMEVSSEALLHGRVDTISFKVVGFTNITEDHLNIHKTLANYIMAKMHLLDLVSTDGYVVINGDDSNLKEIKHSNLFTFGVNSCNDYIISNIRENYKSYFNVVGNGYKYCVVSPLLGRYNAYNVAFALIVCKILGISTVDIIKEIGNLTPISGRGERLDFGQNYLIILDYAHTYNGVKSLLESLPSGRRIVTLTGAAGGREKAKRKLIGQLVLEKSDLVIFTMDDPRNEKVSDIVNDMLVDCKKNNYIEIDDRSKAIEYALTNAVENDIILIIGKGRDNYMAIGNEKVIYSDYDVIKSFFAS